MPRHCEHVDKACRNCGMVYSVPVLKAWRNHCCSSACVKALKEKRKTARQRQCLVCGGVFFPRTHQLRTGNGVACSPKCQRVLFRAAAFAPVVQDKRNETRKRHMAEGVLRYRRGPANHMWCGDNPMSAEERARRLRENTRRYRHNNPHKVREFTQSRSRRKHGRLPKGYIAKLYEKQRGLCPVCHAKLGRSYHTDHITPLAAGGEHKQGNIQLLCPTCNVRKSAKDPIRFMQERGYLI